MKATVVRSCWGQGAEQSNASPCTQSAVFRSQHATWKIAEECGYTLLHLREACGGRPFWLNPCRSALGVSLLHPSPPLPPPCCSSSLQKLPGKSQFTSSEYRSLWVSVATDAIKLQSMQHVTTLDRLWVCFFFFFYCSSSVKMCERQQCLWTHVLCVIKV